MPHARREPSDAAHSEDRDHDASVWARAQRDLIDRMAEASRTFAERYTRADGTFIWRDEWPGMDGSDDAHEAFQNLALLYALGGPAELLPRAHQHWDAATWQFTRFGQVDREFDRYYDWMHHGESSQAMFFLALADAGSLQQRDRAVRFADMYTGADPLAPNWDAERRMLRSPLNGSRGPRFDATREDWSTHLENLSGYHAPFEDLPGVTGPTCPWTDEKVLADILQRFNERMARGDVPVNLNATSLATHAYLWTGEDRYRRWVLDYLDAWAERTAANGGICPDNIGPNGIIGELNDGRWWGGYYGWWWPHGPRILIEAAAIAGSNAVLLDGDLGHLDLARSQIDLVLDQARVAEGRVLVPGRYGDDGWQHYRPVDDHDIAIAVAIWELTHNEDDRKRVEALIGDSVATAPTTDVKKAGVGNRAAYFVYRSGLNPDYPAQILDATEQIIADRMDLIASDPADLSVLEVDDWHKRSPIVCEGLAQLSLGASINLYHGGLLHAPIRHFDGQARRPGLPPEVAVLVHHVTADSVELTVVNLGRRERELIVQAGSFGEHRFSAAETDKQSAHITLSDGGRWASLAVPASTHVAVRARLRRYGGRPSYATPWISERDFAPLIRPRQVA